MFGEFFRKRGRAVNLVRATMEKRDAVVTRAV